MKFKRTLLQTTILSFVFVATLMFSGHSLQAHADTNTLDCNGGASGTQQGALWLPTDPTGVSKSVPDKSVKGAILEVIQIMLGFAGIIAIFFVIIGGYRYIFDSGNSEQAEKGKKTVVNALIGLVIIFLSFAIVTVVSKTVLNSSAPGATSLNGSSN